MIEVKDDWCKGCNICIDRCPVDALEESDKLNKRGIRPPKLKEKNECNNCRYCELMRVEEPVSISIGACGLVNRSSPRSCRGLKVTIGTPRRLASCKSCSMRGLEVATFWPKKMIRSVLAKSSSVTVPTGTPMLLGSATDVLSWHMFELSGRLLVPSMRAKSA